ncbi:Acyl-coenzyme A synthetase/AMP-(fatty) acid ligase [Amycolatopsis xylanica]|uniref:Acyl-coenzyme A synthetase/AMP-(Fatty) acid ligase n=1 Tax=Amycolatopsis xylanica TaxID=589385 RepID=A0A1H2UDF5_9PSEU|nr:AMP-binding protein [Amycolatopsis xylanica]SDW54223.1 Acyl-coenzyme A synthetase/AMP-(fatty) acid ligase [Amycolatopsis xylanica]
MNAVTWFLDRHIAEGRGAAPCLHFEGREVSYGELLELSQRAAGLLRGAGVGAGDRVLIALDDSPVTVACVFGAMRLGAIAVPVNPKLDPAELGNLAERSGVRAMFLANELAVPPGTAMWLRDALDEALNAAEPVLEPAEVDPDAPALIQFTSGSTGTPKGVVHRHSGLLALPRTTGARFGLTPADRCFSTPKLSFGYGFGNSVLLPFAAGASSVLLERPADPYAVAHALRTAAPTLFFSVPALYAALLSTPDRLDFSGVRRCVVGGEGLHSRLVERWREVTGHELVNALGSTECLHIVLASQPGRADLGDPVPGVEVKVVAANGTELPDGEAGEACVRGPLTASHYWDAPAETADVFRDGWVRTGDVLCRDQDAWHYIGRTDDIVNVGGFKVVPSQVEARLLEHEAVGSCAVVGTSAGEFELSTVVAYVVPAGEHADLERALRRHARTRLAPPERPARYLFTDRLPTTVTGKVSRFRLRELANVHTVEGKR